MTRRRLLYVVLGYTLIVLFFSIGVDALDHTLLWIFGVKVGYWFPSFLFPTVPMEGRNLHTEYIFAIYAVGLALGLDTLISRLETNHLDNRRLT